MSLMAMYYDYVKQLLCFYFSHLLPTLTFLGLVFFINYEEILKSALTKYA